MIYEKYDKAIEESEAQLKRIQEKAESFIPRFKDVISKFISEWANRLIDSAIAGNPDITKSLGKNQLSKMKAQFSKIFDSFPSLTNQHLEENSIWAHRGKIPDEKESRISPASDLKKKTNNAIDEALRDLIGEVGKLFFDYGFAQTEEHGEWQARSGRVPRYSYGIPDYGISNSKELAQLKENYGELIDEYVKVKNALSLAIREKESAEAKDLWNQA